MKIIEKDNKTYYQCEECEHIYETEELSNKCEEWCKKHKSCNLEIVKESVNVKEKINFKQLFLGILIGGAAILVLANLKIPSLTEKPQKSLISDIPIEAIEKLLSEKPEIDGIALPEMPSGFPGMPGFKIEKWKIHSIKNGQDQGIFIEI